MDGDILGKETLRQGKEALYGILFVRGITVIGLILVEGVTDYVKPLQP